MRKWGTKKVMFPFFYSYLKASIGSSLEAFHAGKNPKMTPIEAETQKAMAIHNIGMRAGEAKI